MKSLYDSLNRLLAFRSGISLASEVGSGGAGLAEESRKDWLDKGSEDDLSAIGHWKSHPKDKDELKGVVESCCPISMCTVQSQAATYETSRQH